MEPTERGALSVAGVLYRETPTSYDDALRTVREILNRLRLSEKTKSEAAEIVDKLKDTSCLEAFVVSEPLPPLQSI